MSRKNFLAKHWKKLLLIAILITIGISFFVFNLNEIINRERIQNYLNSIPRWKAAIIFIGVYALSVRPVIPIPPSAYTLLSGIVFGPILGGCLSIIGATLNASLTYAAAKWLGHGPVKKWIGRRKNLKEVLEKIKNSGFKAILLIRLSPVGPPFDSVSYAAALAGVSFWAHTFGTLLGIIPGTMLLSYLGATASSGKIKKMLLPIFLAVVLLVLIPWYVRKKKVKKS